MTIEPTGEAPPGGSERPPPAGEKREPGFWLQTTPRRSRPSASGLSQVAARSIWRASGASGEVREVRSTRPNLVRAAGTVSDAWPSSTRRGCERESRTVSVSVTAARACSANALVEIGDTSSMSPPRARGGLIEEVSPISTSAFALHARAAVTDTDTVRLSLSQPLRVEDGQASLTVPAARTKLGRVLRTSLTSPLAPEARQIDLAATWERPLAEGRLRLGVVWSQNPGSRFSPAGGGRSEPPGGASPVGSIVISPVETTPPYPPLSGVKRE